MTMAPDGGVLPGSASLREVAFKPGYDTGTEALHEFYVPALQRAVKYDRSVGFFNSSALSVAARGLSRFIRGGGRVRLLIGASLTQGDVAALRGEVEITPALSERMAAALVTTDDVDRMRLEVLAWLAREKRLQVRVAIPLDDKGNPIATISEDIPYFHEKIGVLRDPHGDGVAFQGSVNESAKAWTQNFESFSAFTSWEDAKHYDLWSEAFERRWRDEVPGFRVLDLPDAVLQALVGLAPDELPPDRDPEERPAPRDVSLLARYLDVAPRLPTAAALGQATIGVHPFPHQRQVAERLAGSFPRSWLVADEVGLGKTISAGLALRRLLLSRQLKRALILAPANVARQWQDELFEKFGLWVPRLDSGRFYGAHPDDVEPVPLGANPYALKPILIVSSHLARREKHRELIAQAAPFDLLVVDETHHARRRAFHDLSQYRPSLLLKLLDDLREKGLMRAVWLLSATPMQIHPIELRDLLVEIGLSGPLKHWTNFERFYRELAGDDGDEVDWRWLATMVSQTPLDRPGAVEAAVLERIERKLGPVARNRVEHFQESIDPAAEARDLGRAGRDELREWIRLRSPVGHLITRHTRETLKSYRDRGLLEEPIADRDVDDVPILFENEEQRLYTELDELLDGLMQLHGSRRNAGFVLTIYRRRLTSSWEAIRRTLHRRLAREPGLPLELDLLDEIELEDDEERGGIDDTQAVPLTEKDLAEIATYLDDLERVPDSKLDQLRRDLDRARGNGQSAIVFTQFTDTLEHVRDALLPAYRDHLATFSGEGGRMFNVERGEWYAVSKQELVDAIRSGRCSVVIATDAASEGLNLQSCSFLINYDLPWNPMRVEQRIGRIDRIGQRRPVVTVLNYTIPGTIEVDVYEALKRRIGQFHLLVGKLQPILGAAEEAVRATYRSDPAKRQEVLREQLDDLVKRIDELEASGIDFVDEDPLPIPDQDRAPVTLKELERRATEDLDLRLARPDHPVTFDPSKASRDVTDWRALVTYGHPTLEQELHRVGANYDADRGPVVFHEEDDVAVALRADRSPPEQVVAVQELDDLGEPHARGEAQEEARRLASEVRDRRQTEQARVLEVKEGDWQQTTRQRFRQLVREILCARVALREMETADEIDPATTWNDLNNDLDGLQYADAFRIQLGMTVDELLPPRAMISAKKEERIPLVKAAATQRGSELLELVKEWTSHSR